jgi:hypothetical protein
MKARRPLSVLVLVAAVAAAAVALADEKKAAAPQMDEKTMMELWQKMATPGEGHKKLDPLVGSWTARNTMWMEPGKPPEVTEGTAEQKWVLGGRYLEQRYEGTMMGQPFSGVGYAGYDNYTMKYESTWMDTTGTAILITRGTFDKAGKVLTSTGQMNDFVTRKTMTMRDKTTLVSPDEILFELFGSGPDGKEQKMMEIRYTRKK